MSRADYSGPESVDPTVFWRFIFWLALVLGSLSLVFARLLAMVPRTHDDMDFSPNYAAYALTIGLMAACILMARWLWRVRGPLTDPGPISLIRIVLCAAWVEGALAAIGILGIAVFQLRH